MSEQEQPRPWSPPAGMPARYWPRPAEIEAPLVCSCCGVSTPLAGAVHAEVRRGWRNEFPPGRFCVACSSVVKGEPVLAVAGLIDPDHPAAPDVWRSLRWYSETGDRLSPTSPYDPGRPTRWAHVAPGMVEDVVAEVTERVAVKRSPSGHGCGGCGVAFSATWVPSMLLTRASAWRPACPDCAELASFGLGDRLADRLAARAAGLTGVPFGVELAKQIGFVPYAHAHPDGKGTDEPFGWLRDDLGRLQEWAARSWPLLLPHSQRVATPPAVVPSQSSRLRLGGVL